VVDAGLVFRAGLETGHVGARVGGQGFRSFSDQGQGPQVVGSLAVVESGQGQALFRARETDRR